MSAKRPPEVGSHRLRTAILQAVAGSERPLTASDIVEQFASSGWAAPPSVKDVRHAVRWLRGRGLVETRTGQHGPGKQLSLTSTGQDAARQGLPGPRRPRPDASQRSGASAPPTNDRGSRRPADVAGLRIAGRHLPHLARKSDASGRSGLC